MVRKQFKIKADVYSTTVHVFFVTDVIKFRNGGLIKQFPKTPKTDYKEAYALHVTPSKYPWKRFIILNEKSDWGTIAQECFHCAKSILDYHDIEDEEAIAHLLTYLVSKIQTVLDK